VLGAEFRFANLGNARFDRTHGVDIARFVDCNMDNAHGLAIEKLSKPKNMK
jgi:hypothetical protein